MGGQGDDEGQDDEEPKQMCTVFRALQEAKRFVSAKFTPAEMIAADRYYKLISGENENAGISEEKCERKEADLPVSVAKDVKQKAFISGMRKIGTIMSAEIIMLGELTDSALRHDIIAASKLTPPAVILGQPIWLPLIADAAEALDRYSKQRQEILEMLGKTYSQSKSTIKQKLGGLLVDTFGPDLVGIVRRALRQAKRGEQDVTMLDSKQQDPAAAVPVVKTLRLLWHALGEKKKGGLVGGDGDDEKESMGKIATIRMGLKCVGSWLYAFVTSHTLWAIILTSLAIYGLGSTRGVQPETLLATSDGIKQRLGSSIQGWPALESAVDGLLKAVFGYVPPSIQADPTLTTVNAFKYYTSAEQNTIVRGSGLLNWAYYSVFPGQVPAGRVVEQAITIPGQLIPQAFQPGLVSAIGNVVNAAATVATRELVSEHISSLLSYAGSLPARISEYCSVYGAWGLESVLSGLQWLGSWVFKCFMGALGIIGWGGIAVLGIIALMVWLYADWKRFVDAASATKRFVANIYQKIANFLRGRRGLPPKALPYPTAGTEYPGTAYPVYRHKGPWAAYRPTTLTTLPHAAGTSYVSSYRPSFQRPARYPLYRRPFAFPVTFPARFLGHARHPIKHL